LLGLILPPERRARLKLLCLGAHADDIEIGCGGTVLRLAADLPDLVVRWIVFSGSGRREVEARNSAAAFLETITEKQIEVLAFRDGYFPFQGADIKDCFEAVKREFDPSLILTHCRGDAHQDHRLLSELAHNTFRDHLVLEYEIPKYDGDLGNPAFFVPLTRVQISRKLEIIGRHFPSQRGRSWFSDETFLTLARLRGIGCNAPEGLAEAFYARKIVLNGTPTPQGVAALSGGP
jgi:LmbE family N-acetylglucosaminyl deacetylase